MAKPNGLLCLRHASGGGGGADSVIVDTVGRLDPARFGIKVAYLCGLDDDLSSLLQRLDRAGIGHFRFPGRRVFDAGQFMALAGLVRRERIGVIHTHDPKTDVYGALLGLLFPRLKRICTLHGWIEATKKGSFYAWLDRRAVAGADIVIAVSEHTAAIARKHEIAKVKVARNGIDIADWGPVTADRHARPADERDRPFTIGYVGRLSAEKGTADFVRVARLVLDRKPGCLFMVIGEGPAGPAMQAAVEAHGMTQDFRFAGYLERDELRTAYESMDVLLLTSHTEGLPITVLEAAASGVCVVATRVGGVPELVTHGQNGLLAEAGDAETLSKHVQEVAADPELAERLRSNGRRVVAEEFSIESRVVKIEEIYERMVPSGPVPGDVQEIC